MSTLQKIANQIEVQIEKSAYAKRLIQEGTQKHTEAEARLQELYAEQREAEKELVDSTK